MHPYIEYVNPHLGKMLTEIGLDKRFVKGSGCVLYDDQSRILGLYRCLWSTTFWLQPS